MPAAQDADNWCVSDSDTDTDGSENVLPRCLTCEYILVGLPGDRCPECGVEIDWEAVERERTAALPINERRSWRKIAGGVQTWLLVLFRPRRFAKLLTERSAVLPATIFALICIAVGVTGNALVKLDGWTESHMFGWAVGVWFHIECQSLVFFLLDFRKLSALRWWSFWRKVSLYTTAFVVLDWLAGPPMLYDGATEANFPWPFDTETWTGGRLGAADLLRGAAYYWWMAVLLTILWMRLRRKWVLLIILPAMPWITMASCRVGYEAERLLG